MRRKRRKLGATLMWSATVVIRNSAQALCLTIGIMFLAVVAGATEPATTNPLTGANTGPSGNPLPRFVSLKADRVNVRIGPSAEHGVKWIYRRLGLPVEIIQEYDHWRKIRDSEGAEGWIFYRLLSGRRTALILAPKTNGSNPSAIAKAPIPIFAGRSANAGIVVQVESGVIVNVLNCDQTWCRVSLDAYRGWIEQDRLWGVYPGEELN